MGRNAALEPPQLLFQRRPVVFALLQGLQVEIRSDDWNLVVVARCTVESSAGDNMNLNRCCATFQSKEHAGSGQEK